MLAVDSLSIEAIRRRLTAATVGRQIYLFGQIDSTNARLKTLARGGAREGTVVLAEGQTAGRGRHGRPWFSPSGVNLYASVLFRPALRLKDAGVFSLIAGLGLADAVKDLGVSPSIKWPNDVLVGRKKVGGSLVECAPRGDEIEWAILGVGVNLNVDPAALREALGESGLFATSLSTITGQEIDRNAFAASYLNHLDAWARVFETTGAEPILAAWRQRDILGGRRVEVRGSPGGYEGRVLGIDPSGGLHVRDTLGRAHTVTGEEIRILD
ncbi:MAG: biotin--[acetyl-CoA-carboxylase] ligase [Candidatus Rokubacteria bacterium]|nr:biotin--[acetyl-CoA-carboxylase] ligase [Candidatus Rokubacteria bacterium]